MTAISVRTASPIAVEGCVERDSSAPSPYFLAKARTGAPPGMTGTSCCGAPGMMGTDAALGTTAGWLVRFGRNDFMSARLMGGCCPAVGVTIHRGTSNRAVRGWEITGQDVSSWRWRERYSL